MILENLKIYEYWKLVSMATSVVLQLNAILLFVGLFISVYEEQVSSSQLVVLAEFSTFFGYCTWMAYVRYRGGVFRYQGPNIEILVNLNFARKADGKVWDYIYNHPAGHLTNLENTHRGYQQRLHLDHEPVLLPHQSNVQ